MKLLRFTVYTKLRSKFQQSESIGYADHSEIGWPKLTVRPPSVLI